MNYTLRKEKMGCNNCSKRRKTQDQTKNQEPLSELRNKSGATGCQCEFKDGESRIFCERHQIVKTRSLYELCRQRHDYFQLWEENRGPLQNLDPLPDPNKKKEKPKQEDPPEKSHGLGDTIEKITKATGIRAVVDAVSKVLGKDCGCEARKEWLNSKVPYKPKKTKGFFT
tara:strand:- start:153 stop:662 length:510 start_codon:yes stop_codon:yes gene_type:complete